MLDNGTKIREKELEDNIFTMDPFIKVYGKMISQMDKV